MLKKTMTYTDYSGNVRTEDFYFNLSKAELAEMELSHTGGYVQFLKKISDEQDAPKLLAMFKDIILKSYGEKSPDGKRFIKSKELSEAFSQTEAYSMLFMEMFEDADAALVFTKGIIPKLPA